MATQQSNTKTDTESSQSTDTDASTNGADPIRSPAIEIGLLGRKDEGNRLTGLRSLKGVVDHSLQDETQVDRLELLGIPDEDQYGHYLCPVNTSHHPDEDVTQSDEDTTDTDGAVQMRLDAGEEAGDGEMAAESDTDDNTDKTLAGTVTNALEEHWPELDYKTGTLDLSPVAGLPVPTSRLLAVEDQTLDLSANAINGGAIELLTELIEAQIPHIYQVLIERAGSRKKADYIVSVRLAVFDEEYGIATDADMAAHLNPRHNYDYRISKPFREQVMTSNFDLNIEALKRLATSDQSNRYRLNGQPIYQLDTPVSLEELASFSEYSNLITGSFSADPRYERHFNRYARIPVHAGALDQLFQVIPAYPKYSFWDRTAVTNGPQFRPTHLPTSASTPQRYEDTTPTPAPAQQRDHSTSAAHRGLVNSIVSYLLQQGYTILAVDQNTLDADLDDPDPTTQSHFPGDSQPDIVAEKDGEIRVFEAEVNDSNPAAFLTNLERAAYFDYPVVVVTQESSDLEGKFKQASRPFNTEETAEPGQYGVHLYNISEETITDGDKTFLLPDAATTSKAFLDHEATLSFVTNGTRYASGHANDPLAAILDGNAPYYHQDGDAYVVVHPSGETERYASQAAVTDTYTPVKLPFIPTQITYLDQTEFRYLTADEYLKRYYLNPTWARTYRNQPGNRHKASRTAFIHNHTTTVDGETLFIPDIRERHRPWHTAQTELDPPPENWFGRNISDDFKAADTDSRDRELRDRTWLYPPGLSPEYPDFPDP